MEKSKKDDTSEMGLIQKDFLKKCEVRAMRYGRKERPDGEKARRQTSKAGEWLCICPVQQIW